MPQQEASESKEQPEQHIRGAVRTKVRSPGQSAPPPRGQGSRSERQTGALPKGVWLLLCPQAGAVLGSPSLGGRKLDLIFLLKPALPVYHPGEWCIHALLDLDALLPASLTCLLNSFQIPRPLPLYTHCHGHIWALIIFHLIESVGLHASCLALLQTTHRAISQHRNVIMSLLRIPLRARTESKLSVLLL